MALASLAAGAQEARRDLPWCLQQGLENNFSIRIAGNRQRTAEENDSRANAGMLPSIDASVGYGANLNSSRSNNRATGQTATNTNYLDQSMQAQIGLTWMAFDGFAMQANYQELQLLHKQGDLEYRMAVEDMIADITAEYYNCIQQRIRLRNYWNAVRLSKERMRIVEERYHIGNFSRLDYMQAKVDFNADSAKYMKQQEAYRNSQIRLNQLLNTGEDLDSQIFIADTVIAVAPLLDYGQLWQWVLDYNTDLQAAALTTSMAEQALRKVLARDYPYVKLNASYGYNYSRNGIAANLWNDRWGPQAGITVGINLYDGSRRSNKGAAKRNIENRKMERENLQLSLEAQFKTLRQSHGKNLQILDLEQQNLITATENYEIARERYLLGDLSGFEMREAQQSLLDAEERILSAAYNTKMCEISLYLISGQIERYLY